MTDLLDLPFEFEEPRELLYEEDLDLAAEDEFDVDAFEAALDRERLELGIITKFDPTLHPRNVLTGQFRDVPGSVDIEGDSHDYSSVIGGHHKITVGEDVAVGPSKQSALDKATELKRKQRAEREIVGRTSPEGLLREARKQILSGEPTTVDKYSYTDPDTGERIYDESRREIHEQIIDAFLRMDSEGNPCESCPRHVSPEDRPPTVFFSGGGFASGKGGVVREHEDVPQGAITLDPDKIKAMLPEFQELNAAGDPEANLRVYEEAWDISQAIAYEIQQEGLDVIVDGVGNTSADEMLGRVQEYLDAGYAEPKAVYVTVPTDIAVQRAQSRADEALSSGTTESLRIIPEDLMRDVHGDVSKVFEEIATSFPGKVELYNTEMRTPQLIGSKQASGPWSVADEKLWDEFLAKAAHSQE